MRLSPKLWLLNSSLFLCFACASTEPERTPNQIVGDLVAHGQYREAVEEAARLSREDPVSVELERLHQSASAALLLEQGRRATLDDNDRFAISRFEEAAKLEPGAKIAGEWLHKTKRKLARRLTIEGQELAGNNQFDEAWRKYTEAIQVLPNFEFAMEAMAQLERDIAHNEAKGAIYYDQGVAALVEKEYLIAANRFGYVRKYRKEDERLARRSRQVDLARSKERSALGLLLEEKGLYHAGRAEFAGALLHDPDNTEAREGVRRCELEAEVRHLTDRGRNSLTRGEFIEAEIAVKEAEVLTKAQKEEVAAMLVEIETGRMKASLEEARSYENDLRYEKAIEAYEQLLADSPGFGDAQERVAALKTRMAKASTLYDRMLAQNSVSEQLTLLLELEDLCPDYRDVVKRIAALERRGIRPNPVNPTKVE